MPKLTPYQERIVGVWQQHGHAEFGLKDPDAALATFGEDPCYIMGIPLGQLLWGRAAIHAYYAREFLPKIPRDFEMTPISRVVGESHIVDEFVCRYTHTVEMPWMLPGLRPSARRVEVFMIAVVGFRGEKMAYEHLMWDHASVLSQVGLVDHPTAALGRTSPAELVRLASST